MLPEERLNNHLDIFTENVRDDSDGKEESFDLAAASATDFWSLLFSLNPFFYFTVCSFHQNRIEDSSQMAHGGHHADDYYCPFSLSGDDDAMPASFFFVTTVRYAPVLSCDVTWISHIKKTEKDELAVNVCSDLCKRAQKERKREMNCTQDMSWKYR